MNISNASGANVEHLVEFPSAHPFKNAPDISFRVDQPCNEVAMVASPGRVRGPFAIMSTTMPAVHHARELQNAHKRAPPLDRPSEGVPYSYSDSDRDPPVELFVLMRDAGVSRSTVAQI